MPSRPDGEGRPGPNLGPVGAPSVILLTAGFTAYTMVNPALGIALWGAGLLLAVVTVVRWAVGKGRSPTR
jgi:hypothetical protein